MDRKTFKTYLDEAEKDLRSNGLNSPSKSEIYECALQKIEMKYDSLIKNEICKQNRIISEYVNDLFAGLKKEVKNEMDDDLKL